MIAGGRPNLIGISGKMGSGKDTLWIVMNYIADDNAPDSIGRWKQPVDEFVYENKKYSEKLKYMVCFLIGCNRSDLEDREFKEKELGEEWTKNIFDGLSIIEEIDEETGEYVYSDQRGKELGNVVRGGKDSYKDSNITLTPRKLLQILGTECGRQIIHPNIWVNALFADYVQVADLQLKGRKGNLMHNKNQSNWIITDVRFPNEAQAIKDRGGILIRINRDNGTRAIDVNAHLSETALDDYDGFDYVIDNDSDSVRDLIDKVKQLKIV